MRILNNMLVTLLCASFTGNATALSDDSHDKEWSGVVRTVLAVSPERIVVTLHNVPLILECHVFSNAECLTFRVGDRVSVIGYMKNAPYAVIKDYKNSPLDPLK